MITLTPPPAYSWSRNPAPIALQSDSYLSTAGFTANAQLVFIAASTAGQTFTITWALASVVFTFETLPDDSGTQLPAGDGSNAYVASLLPYLKGNYYLNRDFIIQYATGSNNITLESRLSSAYYSIAGVGSGTPVSIDSSPGEDPVIKPNFKFLLQVWRVANPDILLYENNLQLDYPFTGIATKDLSDVLSPFMDYDVPTLGVIWQICSKSYMAYYLMYAAVFGDNPLVQKVTASPVYQAFLGGYSNMALNVISDSNYLQKYLQSDPSDPTTQKFFESWPVDNITLKTNSPALLYFVNNLATAETYRLSIVVTFDNGSNYSTTRTGGTLQPYQKAGISCGYAALGLDAYANTTRKVVSYTVQLCEVTSGNIRSQVKTFTVDHSWEPRTRYILFNDSAGNFKVIRLTGKGQLTSDVTDNTAVNFVDQNTPSKGNFSRFDINSIETDQVNTGFINAADDYDNVKEFLLAKKAFRYIDGVLIPINVTIKKFLYSADDVNLLGIQLEYQTAFQEQLYTASSIALTVPQLNKPQPAAAELPSVAVVPGGNSRGLPSLLPTTLTP